MNLDDLLRSRGFAPLYVASPNERPHSKSEVFFRSPPAQLCFSPRDVRLGGYEGPIICVCEAADVIEQRTRPP